MNNENNNAQASPTSSGRRRSSGLMPAFASLQEQKRGSDTAARRASMTDQQAKGGFLHTFFHNNFGRNAEK